MTVIAVVVLAVLLPFVLFDALARPTIRRLAFRNIARRPGEAALVVGGSLLATALITASFIVGDSFGTSIRGLATDRWGPTDQLVLVDNPEAANEAVAAIDSLPDDLIDGTLGAVVLDVSVGSTGEDRQVAPEVRLIEADPAAAAVFTGDPEVYGPNTSAGPAADGLVLNQRVADELQVAVGDPIDVFIDGQPIPMTVEAVRPATGLNGFGEILALPGAVTSDIADPSSVATPLVMVSNAGDVFGGAELTDDAVAAIAGVLGDGVDIEPVKQDLLTAAEEESAEMTELFGTVGGFSVAAGILLVVNLFVMLAGERKSELGTLRAVGLRAGSLVRAFSLEGAVYGLAAALSGVVVGIGVAAAVMALAGDLFDSGDLAIRLDVQAASLVSGAVIGLMVSQVTVLLTSWRITRLNIVRAIRELPEPSGPRRSRKRLVVGAVGLLFAVGLYISADTAPPVVMLAPVIALLSLIPLVDRVVPRRVAVVVTAGAALIWSAAVFGLMPDVMADPEIYMFLLQGLLLVGLATVIVASLDTVWLKAAEQISGGIASRIGLAEPLARPVRTALLVSMYSLVIFTVTFMAVMNAVFQAQAPDFALQAGGGYELFVESNASSGLTAEDLSATDGVEAVAPITRGVVEGRSDPDALDTDDWEASGVTAAFLSADQPPLTDRLDRFDTDGDAWAAVTAGEPLIMVDNDWGFDVGDVHQFRQPDGSYTTFTVAGVTEQGWLVDAGILLAESQLSIMLDDDRPVTRFYVSTEQPSAAAEIAEALTNGGAERGVEATTFLAAAKSETDEQEGFLNMLQAYLGLGLLIGIAGLGVVLVRAVRERRRQFGVMRALGIPAPVVRRAFVVEASFVAVQGVLLGIGLGLLSAWQLFSQSSTFEANLDFVVPYQILVVLGMACLAASLAIAAIPAVRAGRISPAAALRVTT